MKLRDIPPARLGVIVAMTFGILCVAGVLVIMFSTLSGPVKLGPVEVEVALPPEEAGS